LCVQGEPAAGDAKVTIEEEAVVNPLSLPNVADGHEDIPLDP
jgi:hypothetical protein